MVSYGIICQVYESNKFIFIKRKNSIEFMKIVAGKYNSKEQLQIYLNQLSDEEYKQILTRPFNQLFSRAYKWRHTFFQKQRFEEMRKTLKWHRQKSIPFECIYFPKGQPIKNEEPIQTALREFQEETGCKVQHVMNEYLEEKYQGTDGNIYTNIYFYGFIHENNLNFVSFDTDEVSEVLLLSLDEAEKYYPKNRIFVLKEIKNKFLL